MGFVLSSRNSGECGEMNAGGSLWGKASPSECGQNRGLVFGHDTTSFSGSEIFFKTWSGGKMKNNKIIEPNLRYVFLLTGYLGQLARSSINSEALNVTTGHNLQWLQCLKCLAPGE